MQTKPKVYLLFEKSKYEEPYLMSIWSRRGDAEKEAARLSWRACDGYLIQEWDVK